MTGKPGRLQSMGLQRVRHGLATEQQQDRHITSNFAVAECQTHVTL